MNASLHTTVIPPVEDSPAWSAAAPPRTSTSLAEQWFVQSLLDAGLEADARRARFGIGSLHAPERRTEFAELFAPRFRRGVELQR